MASSLVPDSSNLLRKYDGIIQKQFASFNSVATTGASPSSVDHHVGGANCLPAVPPRVDTKEHEHTSAPFQANDDAAIHAENSGPDDVSLVGSLAILSGLGKVPELNGEICLINGFDPPSGRFLVQIASRSDTIKIKRANLAVPARCQWCRAEVTSLQCYSCNGKSPNTPPSSETSSPMHNIFTSSGAVASCTASVSGSIDSCVDDC